jgi:hypothetical protein
MKHRMVRVEHFTDGSTRRIDHEEMPLPTNDPYVRTRQRATGSDSSQEIVTGFAPAQSRPLTYPVGLPFLEGRPVSTTESTDPRYPPGARWRCQDPDVLVEALIEASCSDGWALASDPPAESMMPPNVVAMLSRPGKTRFFLRFERDEVRVIQLLEFPGAWPPPGAQVRRVP